MTAEPDGVVDLTDEANGIVFVDLPDATGDEAAVLNAYQAYESERWAAKRTSTVAESAYDVATVTEVQALNAVIQRHIDAGAHLDGTLTLAPTLDTMSGDTAIVSVCGDESAVLAVFPDQTIPVVETNPSGLASFRASADLVREGGAWRVSSYVPRGEACTD